MQTNPHLFLARRRARQALNPAFVKAVQAKPAFPSEIYGYPALVRRNAAAIAMPLTMPAPAPARPAAPSTRGLVAVYCALAFVIWVVAANVPMGV